MRATCYGYEWDFTAEYTFNKYFLAGLKYADYHADGNSLNLAHNAETGQAFDLARFWAYLQFSY